VAKAANKNTKTGKAAARGGAKQAQTGKAAAKGGAKPARGKTPQRARPQARSAKQAERGGLMKFLHDVRIEMGKVTWPTRRDLLQSTIVVLVAVAIATAYTFGLDEIFSQTVDLILSVLT
jgi:preprotein translocase subunit SecE